VTRDECDGSFDDAVKYCNSIGREIAHIYTEEENKKAMEACGDDKCLIGLFEIGGYASTSKFYQTWKWLNRGELVYTNWESYEPNNWDGIDERYAALYSGKWYDARGSKNYTPLCWQVPEYSDWGVSTSWYD